MVIMDELAIVFCSPLRNDGGFVVVCCQMGIIFTNKHKWSRVPEWSDAFQIKKNNANMISWSYGAHEVVTIWAQPGDSPWSQPGAKLWACCLENQSACEWIPKTLVKYVLLVLLLLIKSVLGILETDHDCACGPKTVPVKRTFLNIAIVGWSGVGWGGMLTFLVLRTWYIAMLLRSLGSFTTLHVATLLRSLGRLLRYMLLRCWDLWDRLLRYWNLMKKSIPSNLSAKSDLLMVYARAWQWRCIHKNADCQLITVHALQRWCWKAKKRAPRSSRISNHQISTALW